MSIKFVDGKLERTCVRCKKQLLIDRYNNINCIYLDAKAYCHDCFMNMLEEKLQKKTPHKKWIDVKNNLEQIKEATNKTIANIFYRDDIYRYVCKKYDLQVVPNKFFTKLADISEGRMIGLAQGIPMQDIFEMWKAYQNDLDTLAKGKNLSGTDRIQWDLSVLINRYDNWRKGVTPKVRYQFDKTEFNQYLLQNYDITVVPNRVWSIISDLGDGIYKGNHCKKVPAETLLAAWKWGKQRLDKIAIQNKMAHRGPQNDEQRVLYDLSIIVNHLKDYQKYVAKTEAEEANRRAQEEISTKINYSNLERRTQDNHGLDDISDLLDEIF